MVFLRIFAGVGFGEVVAAAGLREGCVRPGAETPVKVLVLLLGEGGAEVVERIALPSLKAKLAQLVLAGTSGK